MASPTEAEIQAQLGDAFKLLDELYKFGSQNTDNVIGMYDAAVANLEGDYTGAVMAGYDAFRDSLAAVIPLARRMIDPLLLTYGKVLDIPETTVAGILARLRDDFRDNSKSVKERAFTFGSPSAGGGNTGNGVLSRLTVDENNDDMEAQYPDAKTVECIADEHSGANAEGEEVFEVRGGNASRDLLGIEGSGRRAQLTALTARRSEQFMVNPSFGADDASASPTSITGWAATSDIANFEIVSGAANIYRAYTGEGSTPKALKITASDTLSQNFNERGARFDANTPYYCQVAVNKDVGSGSGGNFVLTLGSQTTTLALSSFAAGWNIVRIAVDQNTWFRNWNQEDPTIAVQWSSASSGYLLVDDVVLAPYTLFDGAYYALVGGSTPFLLDDVFTFSDSETGAIIQFWLHILYNFYLPHSGTPSWADPT